MTETKLSEQEIVDMLQSGDKTQQEKAVNSLYVNPKFFSYAQTVCMFRLHANAQEVHQESFIAFWNNVERLSFSSYGEVVNYLKKTIKSKAKDQRTNRHYKKTSYGESQPSAEEIRHPSVTHVIGMDGLRALWQEILELIGSPCKEILYKQAEGYSLKEIAQLLNMEAEGQAMKKKKQTCREKLAALLKRKPNLQKQLAQFWYE